MSGWRAGAKRVLGSVPLSAELYQRWLADGATPEGGYRLERLTDAIPAWLPGVRVARERAQGHPVRRILVLGCLPWWLEYAVALSLLIRADGHEVDLAYLPHRRWDADPSTFDLRRQAAYLEQVLAPLRGEIGVIALGRGAGRLPESLREPIELQSRLDVQYTLQREQIEWDMDSAARELLRLRRRRNGAAAAAAQRALQRKAYDAIVIPNGSILELGAIYRTARSMRLRTVTYEFGEQRGRMWLAQDAEVMRLPTEALWDVRGAAPLHRDQKSQLEELYSARRGGRSWSHFARRWQRAESEGAQRASERLGLERGKPIALLCTNVVGDSLALDRQVFTQGMADWLAQTVRFFAEYAGAQLVVRVHPGEMLGAGHPSVEIVQEALSDLPGGVTVVPPESDLNTYDLIDLAHVGLVYTTTVGMEMAMDGIPVVVSGATHYRGKGFTHDPESMSEYTSLLAGLLEEHADRRLETSKIELAQRYAYLFFFEYPYPTPWHLIGFWEDVHAHPLSEVLTPEALPAYRRTLQALVGEPIDWSVQEPAASEMAQA